MTAPSIASRFASRFAALEKRLTIIETVLGQSLGISLADFDPDAVAAKRAAEAEAAEKQLRLAAQAEAAR